MPAVMNESVRRLRSVTSISWVQRSRLLTLSGSWEDGRAVLLRGS